MQSARGPVSAKCYLVVNDRGVVRMVKNKPNIGFDEVPIEVRIEVPRAYFERPQLAASLVIPQDRPLPTDIPVQMQGDVQRAIEESTGLAVRLSVVGPEGQP